MKKVVLAAIALVSLGTLAACRGQTSRETPIFGIRNMFDQPKYDIQEESAFFPDHRTMRPLVEGVVAREWDTDPVATTGRLEDETGYVLETPKEVVARFGGAEHMLARGKERYDIYCAACHDHTGSGEGMVKKRAVAGGAAAFVPPTFHQDRIRHMPDGQLFATITNGKSNMPPYAMQIAVDDRWAIVSYVRALQVAQPKLAGAAPSAATPGATAPAQATPPAPTVPAGNNALPAGTAPLAGDGGGAAPHAAGDAGHAVEKKP